MSSFPTLVASPNPARGLTVLSIPSPAQGPAVLSLYDAAGALVRIVRVPEAGPAVPVSLSGLRPGAYLCRLQSAANVTCCRLIVLP